MNTMHKANVLFTVATALILSCGLGAQIGQQSYLKASNTGPYDVFGYSVSVSGDTMVVGAYREASKARGVNGDQKNNMAAFAGAAYVFVRRGSGWTQQAYLKASNTDSGDFFGYSVSISGDTLVVGARYEDSGATGVNGTQTDNGTTDAGAVYVFVRRGSTWTQQAYLKASNPDRYDVFGESVSVSGDTLVVGAYGEDSSARGVNSAGGNNGASAAGAAYVFVRSGGSWSQQAYLKASNTARSDEFGRCVSASGDALVIGAPWANGSAGAAYVFARSGVHWTQQAYLRASNAEARDHFGESVSVSGDTVVVGAPWEESQARGVNGYQFDNGAPDSGAAYVFARSGSSWKQQAYLKASNTDVADYFGVSVAVDGDTVVVGARREASNATGVNGDQLDNSIWYAGAAYMFARSGGTWKQQAYLKASNTGRLDEFGRSVSVSGDTVVVGAPGEASLATGINGDQSNNSFPEAGAVYVFSPATPGSYSTFGLGCAATTVPAALSAATLPKINTTFNLRVSNLRPLTPGILLFGFSDTTWNGIPLPLDLTFLGMKGCNLLVSWDLQVWFTPSGGTWDLPLTLPNNPTLEGLTFYNQAWVIDAKANAFGVGTSNGGKGVIGY